MHFQLNGHVTTVHSLQLWCSKWYVNQWFLIGMYYREILFRKIL